MTFRTILVLLAVIGTRDAQAQQDWLDKIPGRYVGRLVEGLNEEPVLTILRKNIDPRSNRVVLSGEYTYRAEPISGRLEECSAVRLRVLRCTWMDQFGRGTLELEFDETLTSFNGRWSPDSRPGLWFPWTGRITPQT
jgi:hypothetical protein